ncbi:MAG: hypothetical protein D8M53_00350 [Armatimonadetes bacterium]|nr:hypothetical protein [Armatimonadota bacterium]
MNGYEMDELRIALALTPGVGGATALRVLKRNAELGRTPSEFFALSARELQEQYGLREKSASAIAASERLRPLVDETIVRLSEKPVQLVFLGEPGYPNRLAEFSRKPPPMLWLYGNTMVLSGATFAVLGSRDVDKRAADEIERQAERGVLDAKSLVTSANSPAYQRAAVVPLRWGSPRVLVLDRGLFSALGPGLTDEPFRAARLWRFQFDPQTDLVVTEHRPHDGFCRGHNARRDAAVVGLADEIVAVQPRAGGNVERLVGQAQDAGRRVRVIRLD